MKFEVDTIIRFHDFQYIETLKDALLSLAGQVGVKVKPIILCQNFLKKDMVLLQSKIAGYEKLFANSIQFEAVKVGAKDGRTELLNFGLKVSTARFFGFLDCDDVLYFDAYKTLCDRMDRTDSAIAFGAITWADVDLINGYPLISKKDHRKIGGTRFDLFVDNFCPIHSFLIDKTRVIESDLWFSTELSMLEDYHFLLRIVSKYPSDFTCTKKLLGEYRRRSNDTIRDAANTFDTGITQLEKARKNISELKDQLTASARISEFPKLAGHWSGNLNSSPKLDDGHGFQYSDYLRTSKNLKRFESENLQFISFLDKLNVKSWKCGGIDSIVKNDAAQTMQVGGWICQEDGRNFEGFLYCLGSKGNLTVNRVSINRPDVAEMGFARKSGFMLEIPEDNNFSLYAVTTTGQFMKIPMFESAKIAN